MERAAVCLAVYGDVFVCVCLCQTTIKLYNLNLCLGPPASLNFKLQKNASLEVLFTLNVKPWWMFDAQYPRRKEYRCVKNSGIQKNM